MQVLDLFCKDESKKLGNRTSGRVNEYEICFKGSQVVIPLIIMLLPGLLLYLYQAMVLPRVFYSIALFERAHKSLSGANLM
jgi:hypothetical protein